MWWMQARCGAVIKRPNGALATIPLSELIIKD